LITALSYHAPQIDGRKRKADSGDRSGLDEIRVETKAGTRTLAHVENDDAE
jgi:hypothetical protein